MKTLGEINIFRMDLSTEDAVREALVANVSFYLNKTQNCRDQSRFLTRTKINSRPLPNFRPEDGR